jgi:hypothetical protein
MEKAMRKGPTGEPSSGSDPSTMSFDSFSELPEELGIFPPSEEVVVNLVDVYFRLLQDSFFNFLHEGLFTNQLQEQRVPKALLYAVCAASARSLELFYLLTTDFRNLTQNTARVSLYSSSEKQTRQ